MRKGAYSRCGNMFNMGVLKTSWQNGQKCDFLLISLNIHYSNLSQCLRRYFGLLCSVNPILLNRSYRKYAILFYIRNGEYHYRSIVLISFAGDCTINDVIILLTKRK